MSRVRIPDSSLGTHEPQYLQLLKWDHGTVLGPGCGREERMWLTHLTQSCAHEMHPCCLGLHGDFFTISPLCLSKRSEDSGIKTSTNKTVSTLLSIFIPGEKLTSSRKKSILLSVCTLGSLQAGLPQRKVPLRFSHRQPLDLQPPLSP